LQALIIGMMSNVVWLLQDVRDLIKELPKHRLVLNTHVRNISGANEYITRREPSVQTQYVYSFLGQVTNLLNLGDITANRKLWQ